MRDRLLPLSLLVFTVLGGSILEANPTKMLMVTQSKGYRHGSVTRAEDQLSPSEIAMIKLGKESGEFTVDCTQDVEADFTRENLQNYDIVTFYTTGKLPIEPAVLDYFISDWLRQPGHGFLGFHSATDTFKDYRPYWDLVGGSFNGHPWNQNTPIVVTVHDVEFPAMKPFGEQFEFMDEIYQYRNWQPEKVHVLMSLDMEKTERKRPYHVPVAWAKHVGDGKMFYNNLGHREDTWKNPMFLASVLQAVRWVKGDVEGDATPNPEVSARHDAHSEKASHAAGVTLETLEADRIRREAERKAREAANN